MERREFIAGLVGVFSAPNPLKLLDLREVDAAQLWQKVEELQDACEAEADAAMPTLKWSTLSGPTPSEDYPRVDYWTRAATFITANGRTFGVTLRMCEEPTPECLAILQKFLDSNARRSLVEALAVERGRNDLFARLKELGEMS